jgi:hypothetical protein
MYSQFVLACVFALLLYAIPMIEYLPVYISTLGVNVAFYFLLIYV